MRLVMFRGSWAAYERIDGRPKRTSLGTTSRQVAERRLIDLEQVRRRKATTVAEMQGDYFEDRSPHIASMETFQLAWKRLAPVFGHLRPDQITRALSRAYAARERRRGIGNGSIRRDLGVLSAVIRHNDKNSPAIIELPPAPPPRSLYLTREQYREFRDAAKKTPHLYLFVVVAYRSAGRKAAVLELTWDRVDFMRGQIQLAVGAERAKGRARVPMQEDLSALLQEFRRGALTDYVIEYAGKPVHSVKRAFARAAERAGVPWCTPHVLRHTAAVHMAENGVPMSEISQYLGHTSTSVTERVYARFSPDYLLKAANALE
jgi:integrase